MSLGGKKAASKINGLAENPEENIQALSEEFTQGPGQEKIILSFDQNSKKSSSGDDGNKELSGE